MLLGIYALLGASSSFTMAEGRALKRRRLNEKGADVHGTYRGHLPFPRMWPRVEDQQTVSDGRAHPGVWPVKGKVSAWYEHSAALLELFPLSPAAERRRRSLPAVVDDVQLRPIRKLMHLLDYTIPHSFKYKDEWFSLGSAELATFYEDRVLHMVGEIRMDEWWRAQPDSSGDTGVALTFWYSLTGADRLPDAIEAGLRSTELAEFENVFCLTYPTQQFLNMPSHVTILDANLVLAETAFIRVLESNSETTGFVAVLAEWIKQVGARELQVLAPYRVVTTFDCDSLWQRRAIPPIMAYGHASATLQLNPVSFENRNKVKRLIKLCYNYTSTIEILKNCNAFAMAPKFASVSVPRAQDPAHGERP